MRWLCLVLLLVAVAFAVSEDDEVGEFFGLEDTESESEEDLVDLEGDVDVSLTPIHEIRIEEVDDEQPALDRQRSRDMYRRFSRKLKNYMRRKGMTEISQVPTRRFPSHLRRAHRLHQRGNGRINGHHTYRKVMKKVHQKINAGDQELAVCIKVERRAEPKSKLIESLPDNLKPLFQQLYTDKWSRFAECCDRSDIDGKRQCIAGVHAESTNRMCTILSTADITTLPTHFQNKAHCCQSDAGNRQICLQNGRRSNRQHELSPEERLIHTCRRIQMAPAAPRHDSNPNGRWRQIYAERRRDMMECCNKQSLTEKLDCSFDVHLERFDRICDGEENLRPNNGRSRKQELCCTINDEDRVSCFMNRTFRQSVAIAGVELPVDVAGEEKMMGDAPMSHDLTPGGRRGNRRGNKRRGRNERRECCSAGRQARQEMPNDGKAIAMASRECGYRADAYLEEFTGNLPRFCRRVFSRCCSKSSGEQSGSRRQPGRRRNKKRKMTSTQAPPTPQQEEVEETEEEEIVPS